MLGLIIILIHPIVCHSQITFTDASQKAGLSLFKHRMGNPGKHWIIDAMGSGVAVADYDNDGDDDIYFVNGRPDANTPDPLYTNYLFQNQNGKFVNVTKPSGVGDLGYGMCAVFGDVENDGWLDLFVGNRGKNSFYHNNGDGTFTDKTDESGLGDENYCAAAAFADVDLDGDLDLFVGNYVEFNIAEHADWRTNYNGINVFQGPLAFKGQRDLLYLNDGSGNFTGSSYTANINPSTARAMGAVFTHLNDDNYLDLYVTNDSTYNHVLLNNQDGTFEDISFLSGGGFSDDGRGGASMGICVGDYNNDGMSDILHTSYENESDMLYRNDGNHVLEEVSASMGLFGASFHKVTWGCGMADFDADGWLDIYTANGHLYPQVNDDNALPNYEQGISIYHHDGTRYQDISTNALPTGAMNVCARGSALLDFDNDGDMDIVVNCIDSTPLLLENQSNPGNWLKVKLDGTSTQTIGVRVTAKAGSQQWTRMITAGSSYLSQDTGTLHFGFGDTNQLDELIIHWLHKEAQTIQSPKLNQTLIIKFD
jgi:hypothetical protein